jgi:hypothetical protein
MLSAQNVIEGPAPHFDSLLPSRGCAASKQRSVMNNYRKVCRLPIESGRGQKVGEGWPTIRSLSRPV